MGVRPVCHRVFCRGTGTSRTPWASSSISHNGKRVNHSWDSFARRHPEFQFSDNLTYIIILLFFLPSFSRAHISGGHSAAHRQSPHCYQNEVTDPGFTPGFTRVQSPDSASQHGFHFTFCSFRASAAHIMSPVSSFHEPEYDGKIALFPCFLLKRYPCLRKRLQKTRSLFPKKWSPASPGWSILT